jgi:hypothetical protein
MPLAEAVSRLTNFGELRHQSVTMPKALPAAVVVNGRKRSGVPYGSRTRVAAVKGRCPRPLDERDGSLAGIGSGRSSATNAWALRPEQFIVNSLGGEQ